ncbi:exopolysaccharide biosynthesis protein [Peredibacter sp. HCB2-198]|uniref:exopolysaccharide biosynthesis protein n=1 Tax=Peredibacter sp. HCB2-198 TaxID=3383025 RepID=UPI0038B5C005
MSARLVSALEEVRDLPQITLGKIVEHVEGEALLILCLVAILPFMQPIPIPGLSSVLGLIVLLQGIGLTFWSRPLLTKKLKEVNITHEKFEMIYKAAVKFSNFTSKISAYKHPITNTRISHIICGLSITLSAAFLSLPLPIPFSNLIPALSIFMICVGLLEEDIILILIGHGITITVIWMAMLSYALIKEQIQNWL